MLNTVIFSAGQSLEFYEPGDFFRVLDTTVGPVTVVFYRQGAEVSRAPNVEEGYAERFRGLGFDRYVITSASAQTVQFVARDGVDVYYDKAPTGTATITNIVTVQVEPDAVTQAQRTVTNASAQLIAANAARRYFFIQNNDPAGVVYVNVAGAAAAVASGIRLLPGESFEMANPAPSAAISAIGSIASNANVVTVEG